MIALLLVVLSACMPPTPASNIIRTDVGHIVSTTLLPGSWASFNSMQITTDKYVFVVIGYHTIKIGAQMEEVNDTTVGSFCLEQVGSTDCWEIYK